MKLKYYLRGLGIGIIVTAVIMGIISGKERLSDREIKERAAALGMVETAEPGNSLADLAAEASVSEPETSDEPVKTPAPEPESTMEPLETPSTVPTAEPAETSAPAPSEEPVETPSELPEGDVAFIINSGESSYTICRKLEQAGLITSASDFDTYLYSNGYDRKLRAGSFVIPADSDQESIAKILTGGQ